ncbi:hypothetical protein Tco_1056293 [Tanacetum coccineum]|uniref:Uncharacterized protein n=1 Tax=Tanacetum coccineum TaxID=301880 RepID=A0ABQ5H278_9ASTR
MMRMTETDWLNLMMQVGSNPALALDSKQQLIEEYEKICRRLERIACFSSCWFSPPLSGSACPTSAVVLGLSLGVSLISGHGVVVCGQTPLMMRLLNHRVNVETFLRMPLLLPRTHRKLRGGEGLGMVEFPAVGNSYIPILLSPEQAAKVLYVPETIATIICSSWLSGIPMSVLSSARLVLRLTLFTSVYEELANPDKTATDMTSQSRSWKLLFFDVAASFDSAVHRVHAVSFDVTVASTIYWDYLSLSALVLLNKEQTDICHVDVHFGGLWFGTPVKGRNTMWDDMVILFGDIPTVIPSTSMVAPETSTIAPVISYAAHVVETTLVASPTGLAHFLATSYFTILCTDSSEAPNSSDGPPSQDLYVATVARWRRRVTARSSSTSEFPIAPVIAPPGIRRRSAILIRPREAIPFGRPYRTYLNGPCNLLTARKRVGPLPARILACRHASPRSSNHRSSSSSSSDSSPVHSSGLDASDQAHSGSLTRDVPPRLCYPLRIAPRHSEAFHHWCAAPLSTLYPLTTSESSLGDSSEIPLHSSSHSARPSRKRCRSPIDYVPSSTPVMGLLAPTRADLLPPRKRFRDSYSSEASIEEDTEIDPIETEVDMTLGIGDGDDVIDHVEIDPRDVRDATEEYEADTSAGDTVEVSIDPMSALIVEEEIIEPAGEDSFDLFGTKDGIVRSFKDMPIDLNDVVRDFYHHMSEVRIDRIVGIETAQRRLEADQLIARGQRVSMIEMINNLRLENLKVHAMLDIERDRMNSLRLHISLSQEEFHQVCRDRNDTQERLRRLESYVERRLGFLP